MNKTELIDTIKQNMYQKCDVSPTKKFIKMVLDEFESITINLPVDETIKIKGFGVYEWIKTIKDSRDCYELKFTLK